MTHSTFFHFTKSPRYFAAVDEIREEHRTPDGMGWAGRNGRVVHSDRDGQQGDAKRPNLQRGLPINTMGGHPLGKLPGSVWHLTYPQAVERIIKGWAPTGICRGCGEPRRPVVDRHTETTQRTANSSRPRGFPHDQRTDYSNSDRLRELATITGYSCLCPEPTAETDPPTILVSPPLPESP